MERLGTIVFFIDDHHVDCDVIVVVFGCGTIVVVVVIVVVGAKLASWV